MKFDADGGGTIDFVEFLAMMVSGDKEVCKDILSHIVNFREAFTLFDDDESGASNCKPFTSRKILNPNLNCLCTWCRLHHS